MAVYTDVTEDEMRVLLESYDLGEYHSHVGIQAGVSNSNFVLKASTGKYVVTLFEPHRVRAQDVNFFLSYVDHLKQSNVSCPQTFRTREGTLYTMFKDRPTGIFEFMRGTCGDIAIHTPKICFEGGALLAHMHKAGENFDQASPNLFGIEKMIYWSENLNLPSEWEDVIQNEVSFLKENWPDNLPRGPIHGDYFDDNVFYDGETAIGVIDFHFVCTDFYVFDLAIAISAWCFNGINQFAQERYEPFMKGYESVRPLNEEERAAFPVCLRGAAMRFLLSRIEEQLHYKEGDYVVPHDPRVFYDRLMIFQKGVI